MDKETKQAHQLIHSVISTTIALHYNDYINEVKTTSIPEMGELTAIIQAYKKDKNSILGITKKILK